MSIEKRLNMAENTVDLINMLSSGKSQYQVIVFQDSKYSTMDDKPLSLEDVERKQKQSKILITLEYRPMSEINSCSGQFNIIQ